MPSSQVSSGILAFNSSTFGSGSLGFLMRSSTNCPSSQCCNPSAVARTRNRLSGGIFVPSDARVHSPSTQAARVPWSKRSLLSLSSKPSSLRTGRFSVFVSCSSLLICVHPSCDAGYARRDPAYGNSLGPRDFDREVERDDDKRLSAIGADNQKIGVGEPAIELSKTVGACFHFDAANGAEQWNR